MTASPRIVVVGSANTDMVIGGRSLPQPGETVLGGTFWMASGGKGANQAVAAARLGGDVGFVARVGNDLFGERALRDYAAEGIDTTYVETVADVSGSIIPEPLELWPWVLLLLAVFAIAESALGNVHIAMRTRQTA